MFAIAFGIIIAVILLFSLPLIFSFVMWAFSILFLIGLTTAVIYGIIFIVQEMAGLIIPTSIFIGAAILAVILGLILQKLIAGIQYLGGVKNSAQYLRVSFNLMFTERQRLAKATAIKATYETARKIREETENRKKRRHEEREAEKQKKIEDISDELEVALTKKLAIYLEDGSYQVVRDSGTHIHVNIKTRAGDLVAYVNNTSKATFWNSYKDFSSGSKNFSVYGCIQKKYNGSERSTRETARAVLKIVRNHSANFATPPSKP